MDATTILPRRWRDAGGRARDDRALDDPRAFGVRGVAALRPRTALPAQGEARDLPPHGGRAEPARPVRLQARPAPALRRGPARLDPAGAAPHGHDERPGALPGRAVDLQVHALREPAG